MLVESRQLVNHVAMDDYFRRVVAARMRVLELDAPAAHERRLVLVLRLDNEAGKHRGADLRYGGAVCLVD